MRYVVYVDISQFYSHPARSGIQRVIGHLFLNLKEEPFNIVYVFDLEKTLYQVDHDIFVNTFNEYWVSGNQANLQIKLLEHASILLPSAIVNGIYFLPEVTYLANQGKIREIFQPKCISLAMVFDLFPMTHPQFFKGNGMIGPSHYFRELANFDRHVCISEYTRKSLLKVHPKLPHDPQVINLETDFGRYRIFKPNNIGEDHNFIVVGTLEPRKHHLKIFNVFEKINAERDSKIKLSFIGKEGWLPSWQLDYFHEKLKEHGWFEIISEATDSEIADFMSRATGLISVGFEGFGLPILEARSLGCPVIFGGEQPAGNLLKGENCHEIASPMHDGFESDLSLAIVDFLELKTRTFVNSSIETYSKKVVSLLSKLALE
jgi:glycosyltransferase involved in cell wall biosynthesis